MTRRIAWCVAYLTIVTATARADAPKPADSANPVVEETWESVQIDGARVGAVHTIVQTVDADSAKRLRTTIALDLTFKRHNATVQLRMERGDEETADGVVTAVFMRQYQGQERKLDLTGTIEDGRMHVLIDAGRIDRRLRWGDDIVGVYRLEHMFQERKPKPGDHFTIPTYQPTLNAVVPTQMLVKDVEEVAAAGGPISLLRVEMRPDKIEGSGVSVQLPPEIWWLDGDFIPVRRQMELEGLGSLLLTRTTHDAATTAGAGQLPDLNQRNLIPLNRTIPRPHTIRSAVYRIAMRDDPQPETAFADDGHQDVVAVRAGVVDLHVHPVLPGGAKDASPAPAEFLESSRFIDCDDPHIKELAAKAVGVEKNAWKKALLIERWVNQNMRPDDAAPFGPASQAAHNLRGDCRLSALLTAGLCRAEGVPSRTAIGLLYVEKGGKPYLGFHMWTEVFIDGQWLGLDGMLGQGGVAADHVKVAHHSWHGVESLTPLLPVRRVLGKTTVEVVSFDSGD
ncbi:MAG TPA: transglutaminase family protein [Gemmataceae bacterium]|nr:transglutaminase family protein [Gemmataceae bacterium]